MKHLVWLWIAAFCLAVAQVPPVGAVVVHAKAKPCCPCEGKCGMPACPVPAAAPQSAFDTARPLTVARPQVGRNAVAPRRADRKFFASFVPPAVAPVDPSAPLAVPPASVPLFRAHCSFLI
ncbi:MAG TPA: hypothetical protein VG710_11005 [Opitutus sp.]|nr:hypothetical protein [Opitutus sp.]